MKEVISALFDFDGVVMDTESQYTHFWQQIGEDYGFPHLESQVKGQTLTYIYQTFFAGKESAQREITERLNRFEQQMQFLPVPGVESFIHSLRSHGIATAVVTSSNAQKMAAVYQAHPEVKAWFDRIFTAEQFAASKPDVAFKCLSLGNFIAIFFTMLPFLAGIMLRTGAELSIIPIPLDLASDSVFFYFLINVLPTGAGVFFLVCYMAAVLSCGSAFLMGGAPLIVNDVYKSFINKNATQKQLVKVGRVGVVIVAVFGIVGALAIPNLVILFQMGNVFTACGVLIPVLAAFFWKRATKLGGVMACWVGGLTGLITCIWSLTHGGDYMLLANGFPVIMVGLIASLIAIIIFSFIQKPEPDELVNVTLYSQLSTVDEDI